MSESIFSTTEKIMEQWSRWVHYYRTVESVGTWPRDAFESLLEMFDERESSLRSCIAELEAENEKLQRLCTAGGRADYLNVVAQNAKLRKVLEAAKQFLSKLHSAEIIYYRYGEELKQLDSNLKQVIEEAK